MLIVLEFDYQFRVELVHICWHGYLPYSCSSGSFFPRLGHLVPQIFKVEESTYLKGWYLLPFLFLWDVINIKFGTVHFNHSLFSFRICDSKPSHSLTSIDGVQEIPYLRVHDDEVHAFLEVILDMDLSTGSIHQFSTLNYILVCDWAWMGVLSSIWVISSSPSTTWSLIESCISFPLLEPRTRNQEPFRSFFLNKINGSVSERQRDLQIFISTQVAVLTTSILYCSNSFQSVVRVSFSFTRLDEPIGAVYALTSPSNSLTFFCAYLTWSLKSELDPQSLMIFLNAITASSDLPFETYSIPRHLREST